MKLETGQNDFLRWQVISYLDDFIISYQCDHVVPNYRFLLHV